MAIFRSFNDLVISFLDYLRLVQPELDTKPGTVSRDLFVDSPSQQIAELYSQLRNIASMQSFFSVSGTDLSLLASNFGVSRRPGTPSVGVAVFTTNNLDTDILIPAGSVVVANNGISFKVINNFVMNAASANVYKATATRLADELNLASITDQYAAEVTVEALTTGTAGNIGVYSLITQNITGVSRVTNLQTFAGGTNPESDDAFRSRILSVFAGSNTGTALGYTTSIEALEGVSDSIIIVPGDPLLIRDGTQVTTDADGNLVVSEPGSGGKVDIYILGSRLQSQVDSIIYNDKSGKNDPTDPANDFILGQRGETTTVNAAQRRVTTIESGLLPYQPVYDIVSVAGSSSGANFAEKYTDSAGQVHGNYELIKDSGDFGGSPFGFDRLHWTSSLIELSNEEKIKGTFNGVDQLNFTDVDAITSVTEDVLITNENSTTSSITRSNVKVNHVPVSVVDRITNLTTGERYVIEDQNPDGVAGELNTTGNIKISGSTLPVGTDVLQVDYTWVKSFDKFFDFDNLHAYNSNRTAQDSIDWGFSNLVKNEPAVVDAYGTVTVSHNVFKVLHVNTYSTDVSTVDSGIITANTQVNNIIDIRRVTDNAELYNTDAHDGSLTGTFGVILPSDTIAEDGDLATVRFNANDLFNPDGYASGTFFNNIITLPEEVVAYGGQVLVTYVADVSTLLTESNLSDLPAQKIDNFFLINDIENGNQPTSNLLDNDNNIIYNLRKAGTNLRVVLNSISGSGSISILGTSVKKLENKLVVVTAGNGYEIDFQYAIMDDLGVTSLPSSIKISCLASVERVIVDKLGNISSVDNLYDIMNYKLKDNSRDLERARTDSTLTNTKVMLPETINNTKNMLNTGDIVRVSFYYINTNDSELLYFSKGGEQITTKAFVDVSKVYINHGFTSAAGDMFGTILINNFNQPQDNTSYSVGYNYIAPKENERITITFNNNALVSDAVFAIEDVRPITADVLVKQAKEKAIDVSIRVVILSEYLAQEQTVLQDAVDAVTGLLSATSLGTTIDASDVVNVLYSVQGIDRVKILNFSHADGGNVLSIVAEKNEYLIAGTIDIQSEER